MRTKGDFRRCTMQKKTSKVRIYILPYSENDGAVTLKKGTAAMEEQQLFTTGWLQPQILWEHNARLLREQFRCEAYVRMSSVNKFKKDAGRRAPVFFQYSSTHNIHEIRIWKNRDIPQILTNTKRSRQHCQPWAIPRHKWSGIEKEKDLPATSRQVLAWCNHQMWKLSPAAAVSHRHQASA